MLLTAPTLKTAISQNGPVFRFAEKAGPRPVGLKIVEHYDYSRVYRSSTDELGKPYGGQRARPLQSLVWYPAEHSGGAPMTVRDYVNLLSSETSFGSEKESARATEWLAAMSPTLAQPLWAVRDAAPAAGVFPVAVYAPSFSSVSWENADLCEYLASHGYVVLASACMGATTRNMTHDLVGVDTQARDIAFLISYACTLPHADIAKLTVIGFSWGGLSNLVAAARDDRINALVCLDGSLRYSPGLVQAVGEVHPERMTIPLLSFAQRGFSFEDQARYLTDGERYGPSVLNAWTHGDLVDVHMLGICHAEHSSMLQRNEDVWWKIFNLWPMTKADYGREDGITGYAWMARYTRAFLDAYLKHDSPAKEFLSKTPTENGVPPHVMAVTCREASGAPWSENSFRAQIGRSGFDCATEIYAAMQKGGTSFRLDEEVVKHWSEELINNDHWREATLLLRLNVQMYPESSDAWACAGRVYEITGERELALESYRTSLQRDPFNAEARKRLSGLEDRE